MIDRVLEWSLRNRFLVLCGWLAIATWGLWAMFHTPIDAIPDLSENQVIVYADWPGRAPQEVEDQVTYPLTTTLQGLAGIKTVRSSSAFGLAMINVIFQDNIDLYFARTRVLEKLATASSSLPAGVAPTLGPDASGVGQIFWYTLEAPGVDLARLRSIQDWYVRYQLGAIPGVAEVASIGGFVKQYQIDVDPGRLAARGISLSELVMAVGASNANVGAKVVESHGAEYIVRGVGLIENLDDIGKILITTRAGVPLFVRDVAEVTLGPAFRRGILDRGGQETVGGVVIMRQGESASEIIGRVKDRIAEIGPGLPEGTQIVPFYDRSALIGRAVDTLRHALIEELILVTLAHVLFLAHFRSILIVTAPLPLAILMSFLMMHYLGITSNIMSLGGIAIAIGVLVDAGIVVTENAIRHAEQAQDDSRIFETVLKASRLVVRPIFFSMAIIILAFVPVFTLTGQEGKLFHPLAFTKTFAMIGSTLLAITLVPVLCTLLIRGPYHPEDRNPVMRVLTALYRPVLRQALRHRYIVLSIALTLFGTAVFLATRIGNEFMPPLNEGDLLFMPVMSPATSLTQAREVLQAQDRILETFPEVDHAVGKAGRAETSTDPAPISMFETVVALKPLEQWRPGLTRETLIQELDAKLRMTGVTNIWTQPIINRIDMLTTGIRTQVGVKVFGPDLATLEKLAKEIEAVVAQVPGVADLYAEQITGAPYLELHVDREAAGRYGMTVADVQQVIEVAIGGKDLTTVIEGRARYAVQVRYARQTREDPARIGELPVRTPAGALIPLSRVARIALTQGPSMISSENGLLRAYVLMNVRGRDVGSFVEEAKRRVQEGVQPPSGYTWEWSGQFEHQIRARRTLELVVPGVLFIIFLLLYVTYGSFQEAAHVVLAVPFALTGGVFLVYALGYNFSVAVWIGFIALFGTAVQTGVVMVIYLQDAVKRRIDQMTTAGRAMTVEDLRSAVMEGALLRLRPKVMTVSTVVAGLLPLFWTTRTGSEVMKPLAAPVLGGMVSSLLHVLIVTPVIFLWLRERGVGRVE